MWAWRGGVARRETRATRVPLRHGAASPPPGHERGNPLCVCVCHTARRTLRGVQLVRQGPGAGRAGREGSPHATRRGRRWATACAAPCACDRRAGGGRALEPKRCASHKFADGGGHYQRTKNRATRSSRAGRPGGEPEACVSTGARVPRGARLPRAARAPGRKKGEERRPPEGHRQPRRRTGCTPETHALQNDTPRPEPAPAGMLQGLPIAAERRAVGWGEMGRGAGEGVATSTTGFLRRRARASGEERLVPTSSRILFHLSRLMVAVSAANPARCGCRAGQRLAVGRVWGTRARRDVDHWLPAARALARGRGAARADFLPADSSPFPVKGCSSGRDSGSLRLPGSSG